MTRPLALPESKAVFVDSTGWRARLGRRLGLAAGAVLIVFMGALGLGMATGPSVPLPSWGEPSPRSRVEPDRPDVPAEKPPERGTAANPEPTRRAAPDPDAGAPAEGPAPSASSAPPPTRAPRAMPTPDWTASHPGRGKSEANPPAWGHKKRDR